MDYMYLVSIAIILISTKVLGDITGRFHLTEVVGALLAGVLIGPGGFGLISETDFIANTAEIGVILLMFNAGLDTDTTELKKNGVPCFVVALLGVIFPIIGGATAYHLYFGNDPANSGILKAVFVGVILAATSVSITVEALRELGKLEGRVGSSIMGAAVIDDIMGIIVLTVVLSLVDDSVSLVQVLGKIVIYAVLIILLGFIITKNKDNLDKALRSRRHSIFAVAACLFISFASEEYFGVADITGAYMLGMFLSKCEVRSKLRRKLEPVSYLFFSPIFFASIGLKVNLDSIGTSVAVFSVILAIVAIITKLVACGLGAKMFKYTNHEALQVGIGMISRGEVALIVAQKGYAAGLVNESLFPAIVVVVIVTTIITPVLLKKVMEREPA